MKLKYYLRGLGIGMAVTAIVLSLSFAGRGKELSDAEIIARAKELGYAESHEVLAERKGIEEDIPSVESVENSQKYDEPDELPSEASISDDSVSSDSTLSENTVSSDALSDNEVSENTVSSDSTYEPEP